MASFAHPRKSFSLFSSRARRSFSAASALASVISPSISSRFARQVQRIEQTGRFIPCARRFGLQVHFLLVRQHPVEHVPHFVRQFDVQGQSFPVYTHEPFAEAGKHAFQLARGGLAFPQVLLETARQHFLLGAVPGVFFQPGGQGVEFRAAVSGYGMLHKAVVVGLEDRVVVQNRRPFPQGGQVGQHPFVGQPFPFQAFHL